MAFGFLASDYNYHCYFLNDLSIFGKNRSSETKIPARQTGIRCFLLKLLIKSLIRRCGLFRFAQRGRFFQAVGGQSSIWAQRSVQHLFSGFQTTCRLYGLAGSSEKAFCFVDAVHTPIKLIRYHCFVLHSEIRCPASVYQPFRPILLKRAASLPCKHAILPFLLFPFSDDL